MKVRRLADGPLRTYAVVFEEGDEVLEGLLEVARSEGLKASHLTAIGAFSDVTLSYFDWETKDYRDNPVREQVEVVSLVGDIARSEGDDEPKLHLHVVIGKRDGSAMGGHLREAHVRPTLEVVITETPDHLVRRHDPETGLALIDLDA